MGRSHLFLQRAALQSWIRVRHRDRSDRRPDPAASPRLDSDSETHPPRPRRSIPVRYSVLCSRGCDCRHGGNEPAQETSRVRLIHSGNIMDMQASAPYGTGKSPITADLIVQYAVQLGSIQLDGEDVYWTEMRPAEGGRKVIVRRSRSGPPTACSTSSRTGAAGGTCTAGATESARRWRRWRPSSGRRPGNWAPVPTPSSRPAASSAATFGRAAGTWRRWTRGPSGWPRSRPPTPSRHAATSRQPADWW